MVERSCLEVRRACDDQLELAKVVRVMLKRTDEYSPEDKRPSMPMMKLVPVNGVLQRTFSDRDRVVPGKPPFVSGAAKPVLAEVLVCVKGQVANFAALTPRRQVR